MKYYDKDVISSTTNSTITSFLGVDENGNNIEGEDIEIDWESEYSDLTGESLKALTKSELEEFYDKCYKVKSLFKKSTENAEGIFGAEEIYDITSEVDFSTAIVNMKTKMEEFCKGAEFSSVWTGLTDYNIERTYMMAKNIMSSNRIKDEYAYYNIGTNIITYTPGRQGTEYMLMDLQKINLKAPLKDENNNWTNVDSDNDGILDGNELGDDTNDSYGDNKIKVDITGFIKKALEKELYGNNEKDINENQKYIKEVLSKVKFNIYNQRNKFDKENSENNKLNWKEVYENNLNIDDKTKRELDILDTDTEKQKYLKITPAKLEVELWKYKSNPVLKDTDFDGIDDGFGYERDSKGNYLYVDGEKVPIKLNAYKDKTPKDNYFRGRMHSTRISGVDGIEVDMNMDYRYFFLSNKLYYDELSEASILYADSIYMKGDEQSMHSGLQIKSGNNLTTGEDMTNKTYRKEEIENMNLEKFKNMPVKEMMEHFGFKDVRTYYMGSPGDLGDENRDYFIENYSEIDTKTNKKTGRVDESKLEKDDTYKGKIGNRYKYKNENKYIDEIYMGYKDTHKGRVAIGYKNIEYHGLNKTVVGIVIRGTAEDDDWDSDFDMGDVELRDEILELVQNKNDEYDKIYSRISERVKNGILDKYDKKYSEELLHFAGGYPDWKNINHHAGFDIVANRILEIVREYYNENYDLFDEEELDDNNLENNKVPHTNEYEKDKVCFWVMGHSMGGGVANLVGAELINGECGGNENNVYCYTFAAPNTFYLGDNESDNYREPKGVKYRGIFNIVNEDDFVPELPMRDCGWTRYGREAKLSIEKKLYKKYYYKNLKEVYSQVDIPNGKYNVKIDRDYKYYCGGPYHSNIGSIIKLIKSFNDVYSDKYTDMDMRRSTYSDKYKLKLNDPSYMYNKGEMQVINPVVSEIEERLTNARCYQKIYKEKGITKQLQMPAYFLQGIAYVLHEEQEKEGMSNGMLFGFHSYATRYTIARGKLISAKILYGATDFPHYLESYYSLAKEMSMNDFDRGKMDE